MAADAVLTRILRRDQWVVAALLGTVALVAWLYVLAGAGMEMAGEGGSAGKGMDGMDMTGGGPLPWSVGHAAVVFAMWWGMMVAMMLPSASPMILLFTAVNRRQRDRAGVPVAIFTLGYLAVWGGFSLAATGLQWGLTHIGLLAPDLALTERFLAGALLVVAGIYQWSPLKQACLKHCRSPLQFLMTRWRSGRAGAFVMGLDHGAFCLGCCWFLMLLLFVGGVMNLYWIAGLALFVLFEKTVPAGHWLGRGAGVLLAGWGGWLLVTS